MLWLKMESSEEKVVAVIMVGGPTKGKLLILTLFGRFITIPGLVHGNSESVIEKAFAFLLYYLRFRIESLESWTLFLILVPFFSIMVCVFHSRSETHFVFASLNCDLAMRVL